MREISNEYFNELVDQMYDFGVDFEPRTDYSGRGMMGKECIGFVTENPAKFLMTLGAILAVDERNADDAGATYEGLCYYDMVPRTDSMGLDSIVYFPNVAVAK